jgi:hypothetical protein
VKGAVARLAEDAYQRVSEAERRRARPILLRLAGDEEEAGALVRRRVPLDELEVDRDESATGALAVLTESRLVTVDEGTVEVAHGRWIDGPCPRLPYLCRGVILLALAKGALDRAMIPA